MTKKLAIVDSDNKEIILAIKNYFESKDVEIQLVTQLDGKFDLVVLTGFETEFNIKNESKVLNIYPSILPAFKDCNPIKEAFLSGVKVSGVSVHQVLPDNFYDRILAQYPVLIGNTTHIDEFTKELFAVSNKLYPVVIDAVLNDKVFDFSDLFKSSCSGNCGGCNGCH
jgi:phosphoribosylglycinamide formyltransferase-1